MSLATEVSEIAEPSRLPDAKHDLQCGSSVLRFLAFSGSVFARPPQCLQGFQATALKTFLAVNVEWVCIDLRALRLEGRAVGDLRASTLHTLPNMHSTTP